MSPICRSVFSCTRFPVLKERKPFDPSLYLIADRPSFRGNENQFCLKIRKLIRCGVSCVQLRDHQSDFATTLERAIRLRKMLERVPFFINTPRSLEVARIIGADGVYLEDNSSPSEARSFLGNQAIIGGPIRTIEEANQKCVFNYRSVKIFPSNYTCPRNDLLLGMEGFRHIRAIITVPLVLTGGFNIDRVKAVYRELRPGDGIATAGLMREKDYCLTAQKMRAILTKVRDHDER